MAPVKAPFSWPNSSLSKSPVGMAAQLSLTKVRLAARAQLVQGAGDELLARARLAANEHRGAGGGDGLDLLEHPAQGGALADDLPEVVLGADLLLQVGLLLGSSLDLPKAPRSPGRRGRSRRPRPPDWRRVAGSPRPPYRRRTAACDAKTSVPSRRRAVVNGSPQSSGLHTAALVPVTAASGSTSATPR